MAALDDVSEILHAHQLVTGGARGAPRIANGARIGSSLLRAAAIMISAAIQTEVEEAFKAALPLTFNHFTAKERERYWQDCKKSWGNPNSQNVRNLFFRIGLADALDGLSWQKCPNAKVIATLDAINQVRNRIAHGQPLTVNGNPVRLTRPVVGRWRSYAGVFLERFRPFILNKYQK